VGCLGCCAFAGLGPSATGCVHRSDADSESGIATGHAGHANLPQLLIVIGVAMRLRPTQENGLQPFSTFLTAAPLNECEIASHELTIERESHGRDAGFTSKWIQLHS
jgi:hypothetical protein